MKFKLDENMPSDLARMLKDEGNDVSTVKDEGLHGFPDPQVLDKAAGERRILLTFDQDFADIRTYPPGTHSGIIVFRLRDQRWLTLELALKRLMRDYRLEALAGALTIVQEEKIRHRRC